MSWGLENRLSRIIRPQDGRTVMLAIDHGYFLGPTSGLECPGPLVDMLAPLRRHAHAHARRAAPDRRAARSSTPIVLRVSGGNSVLEEDLSNETIITSIEECIRLNAAGMALSIFVGSEDQHQTIANLAKLVDEGERYGHPGARRDRGRQGDGPRRALPRSGLPHRRRDGRAHRQDLLLRRLRARRRLHAGADRDRGRQEAAGARGARAHLQRHQRMAPSASTWGATSSSPTRPSG